MILEEKKLENGISIIYNSDNDISSGSYLRIIPVDPKTAISKEQAVSIIQFLNQEFPGKRIEAKLESKISFVDCGGGLESIKCPCCGKEMETDDWQKFMDKAYEKEFEDLKISTTCCGSISNLNELKYEGKCGFAKSIIEMSNAEYDTNLNAKIIKEITSRFGLNTKAIYANY